MAKYICSVCGYVYDEAKGIPEDGIAPGTSWEDIPEDWVCPICGASKEEFRKEEGAPSVEAKPKPVMAEPMEDEELTPLEMSILCTNLARGLEKQYKPEEAALFFELGKYFESAAPPAENPSFDRLEELLDKDMEEGIPAANAAAADAGDRGAKRALVWSEKVTRILKSLLARYQKEGEAFFENTNVYVCTICGFVYIGDTLPDVCPVCKVPNWKFEKMEGGRVHV